MEIAQCLSEYISKHILGESTTLIQYNERIISSGIVDSFHLVDLASFIEEVFGVNIDISELNAQTFDSINELTDLIKKKL